MFHVRSCLKDSREGLVRGFRGPRLRRTQGSAGVPGPGGLWPSAGGCGSRPGPDIRSVLRLWGETEGLERGAEAGGGWAHVQQRLPSESLPALPPTTLTRAPPVGAFSDLRRRRGSERTGGLPRGRPRPGPRRPASGCRRGSAPVTCWGPGSGSWSHAAGRAHSRTHVGFAGGSSRQTALRPPESGGIEFSTVLGARRTCPPARRDPASL